jgi:3-oxoacyl-[acyl-carrier-protein] synthase-1
MSEVAEYAAVAAEEAIKDSGLAKEDVQRERTGLVVGTMFSGIQNVTQVENMILADTKLTRVGANGPVKIMNSSISGNLASYFGIQSRAYSLSTACSTGSDNIGHAFHLLRHGILDVCICGSAEEDTWKQIGAFFDNSGEMARRWNNQPTLACRPFDRDRGGFVLSSGAGIVVLETLEHARLRNARIHAELLGYGSGNDGADMYQPTGKGLREAICQALHTKNSAGIDKIDYVNPHGTGTHIGDKVEVQVIKELLGSAPLVSSTKSLTGHALGAAGSLETIFTILMLSNNFVSATANLENIAPECEGIRHVQERVEVTLQTGITLNSGLGGTNACLVISKNVVEK